MNIIEFFSNNQRYKNYQLDTDIDLYKMYLSDIINLKSSNTDKFLDCGCGTGNVLRNLDDRENNYGIDVSEFFIEELKNDGYNVTNYEGGDLPYPGGFFGIVGSFTVLEHVEHPDFFIQEQIRVLKTGGYLIVACPNFLSVFNNVRSYSLFFKFKSLFYQYIKKSTKFIKMDPIIREADEFLPDDDAIVLTNPIQLRNFLKKENVLIVRYSGFMSKSGFVYDLFSRLPVIRHLLPSCYFVCRKVK
ncbi:methyltransferase domain-containing protein [Patescibacteria group bacterium]|nr:methyltransferase domain-containing protein [Patescibacteria group bacterium]